MPTYQYVCTSCGEPHEAVQSFSDAALTECPHCAGGQLRKVFGSVGVVFKGSGFYRTDSRGKSSAAEAGASGDSKPAAKSEPPTPGATSSPAATAPASKPADKPAAKPASTKA